MDKIIINKHHASKTNTRHRYNKLLQQITKSKQHSTHPSPLWSDTLRTVSDFLMGNLHCRQLANYLAKMSFLAKYTREEETFSRIRQISGTFGEEVFSGTFAKVFANDLAKKYGWRIRQTVLLRQSLFWIRPQKVCFNS